VALRTVLAHTETNCPQPATRNLQPGAHRMLENTELPTEEAHSKSFTVIGFWTDTDQRFCDVV
jgi:hypothetical protein